MIDCKFRTALGSCSHVDESAGRVVKHVELGDLSIILTEDVCEACIASQPDEQWRGYSRAVKSWKHLASLDKKPCVRTAPAKTPCGPAEPKVDAPIISDPQARLEICEDCPKWINDRCKMPCGCRQRPRPMAADGPDCPAGKWRRPPNERK